MLLKMLMMVLVPMVDDTYVLVLTFGFAIIELIYIIPAIGRIFDGFEYFGTRFNGNSIYSNYKNVRTITFIFFFAKILLPILPELSALSDYEYDGYVNASVQIDFATYKSALLIIGIFIMTLIGIMWLVNIIPYFRRIGRETAFLERVSSMYDLEIANNTGLNFRRSLYSVLAIFSAGLIFFMNFWADGVNIIPNFIGAAFLILAAAKLSKISDGTKLTVRVCMAFTAVSAVSYTVSLLFSIFYGLNSIGRDFAAYDLYNITRILSLLEYAAMFASVLLLIQELRKLIATHLGPDQKTTDHRLINIHTSQQRELDGRFLIVIVSFTLAVAVNLVYLLFRAEIDDQAPGFWILPFLANGVWWIYTKSILDHSYRQIEYKYL